MRYTKKEAIEYINRLKKVTPELNKFVMTTSDIPDNEVLNFFLSYIDAVSDKKFKSYKSIYEMYFYIKDIFYNYSKYKNKCIEVEDIF